MNQWIAVAALVGLGYVAYKTLTTTVSDSSTRVFESPSGNQFWGKDKDNTETFKEIAPHGTINVEQVTDGYYIVDAQAGEKFETDRDGVDNLRQTYNKRVKFNYV